MNKNTPPNIVDLMAEGFFSGPCFGDESPSNSSVTGPSRSPLFLHTPEDSEYVLLSELPKNEPSPSVPNEDQENRGVSLENTYAEPMDIISPTISLTTYDIEIQMQIESDNLSEQPPFEGGVSQSPNSRRIHLSEKLPVNFGNNTSTIDMPSPLIDPESYNPPSTYYLLDHTADVVPEPLISSPSIPFLPNECQEATDHAPSLKLTSAIENSYSYPANGPHSPLPTELDVLSSSPPTSSPPQIFSSSPLASSQASEISEDSQGKGAENAPKYIEQEVLWEDSSYDDRNSSSATQHGGSRGSPPPDLGDSADISHPPSCRLFPHTEPLSHQPLVVSEEIHDPLGNETRGQEYFSTKHFTPQMLSQDPELLSLTLPDSKVFTHEISLTSSPPFNGSLMQFSCPDPVDSHEILSTSLILEKNNEQHTSPQSSPTASSLPLSSPLGPLSSSPPSSAETDYIQSTPHPANIILTMDMDVMVSDNKQLSLPSPPHPQPSGLLSPSLLTGSRMIQPAEPSWEANNAAADGVAPNDVKFPNTEETDKLDMHMPNPTHDLNTTPGKRKRDATDITGSKGVDSTSMPQAGNFFLAPAPQSPAGEEPRLRAEEGTEVHMKASLPNPKRSTVASQKLQHKKLTTPFRSPILKRPKLEIPPPPNQLIHTSGHSPTLEFGGPKTVAESDSSVELRPFVVETTDVKKRHRTRRAASQFKSPLSLDASSRATSSSVRLTPTIQALERKLQILKRAVKVKHDGDEEALEALVKKWTEAGREVAWEIWELVKDNASSGDGNWDQPKINAGKRPFEEGWGWDEKSDQKKSFGEEKERNWGWDVVPNRRDNDSEIESDEKHLSMSYEEGERYQDEDDEKKQDTLGTMLMQLGIAPDTLGWNEEEGVFVGE